MPTYKSNFDEERYLPTLGITVKPQETFDVKDKIDAVGLEEVSSKAKPIAVSADASAEGVAE